MILQQAHTSPSRERSMKFMVLLFSLAIISISNIAIAEDKYSVNRRSWQKAVEEHKEEGPVLWVQYPREGANFSGTTARYSGCTEPGSTVSINGKLVHVYPAGSFAGIVSLKAGSNKITIRATRAGKTTEESIQVTRNAPVQALAPQPLAVGSKMPPQPLGNLELIENDVMKVRCQSVPGAKASFQIGKRGARYPMRELPLEPGKASVAGIYEGVYTVQKDDVFDHASIKINLETFKQGKKQSLTVIPTGTLTAGDHRVLRLVSVKEEDTPLYSDQSRKIPIINTTRSTQLFVTGKERELLRTRLGLQEQAWVAEDKTDFTRQKRKMPTAKLKSISLVDDPNRHASKLSLAIAPSRRSELAPLPFRVDVDQQKQQNLSLTVYGLKSEPFHALPQPGEQRLSELWQYSLQRDVAQSRNVFDLRYDIFEDESTNFQFALTNPVWGYDSAFGGDTMDFWIMSPPILGDQENGALTGITIALDAGHGGSDYGALGSSGVRESDVNMAIAQRVAVWLRSANANVIMVRKDDEYVTLTTRSRLIAKSGADLFLSIHCNSISEESDPFSARGSSIYYFFPQGKELAGKLRSAVAETTKNEFPIAGPTYMDFRVIRASSQMPGALFECMFLSNPDDEALLLDAAFLDRMSMGIYKGVYSFLREFGINRRIKPRMIADTSRY